MNKYQRALDDLDDGFHNLNNNDVDKIVAVFKELVDKATPKKPPKHDKAVCPTCNSKANYGHPYTEYCCHCGQALDWNEDD